MSKIKTEVENIIRINYYGKATVDSLVTYIQGVLKGVVPERKKDTGSLWREVRNFNGCIDEIERKIDEVTGETEQA